MRVLIACEFSGIVRDAFRELGHSAYSCDLLPTEHETFDSLGLSTHFQCDVRGLLDGNWDLLIAHPPCTHLTRSGARWLHAPDQAIPPLKGAPRWEAAKRDAEFFRTLRDCKIPRRCIENPRMHPPCAKLVGSVATQFVQPWMFGRKEIKATGLELINLPLLVPTNIVGPPPRDRIAQFSWATVHRASPGPDRWKVRSRTVPEIAAAMAAQWGGVRS